jgi:hypothetical protein
MTKDEALKMAIEFMQREHEFGIITDGTRNNVINACKQALEKCDDCGMKYCECGERDD